MANRTALFISYVLYGYLIISYDVERLTSAFLKGFVLWSYASSEALENVCAA